MKTQRQTRVIARTRQVLCLLSVLGLSTGAAAQAKTLTYLGFQKGPNVPDAAYAALAERIGVEIPNAAKDRAFVIVPLDKVSGVAKQAADCQEQSCRKEIASRLNAQYVLSARIERLGQPEPAKAQTPPKPAAAQPGASTKLERKAAYGIKDDRPVDILIRRPVGLNFGDTRKDVRTTKGYRLTVWLEGDAGARFIDGYKLDGEVPFLVGQVPSAILRVLESASPKRVAAMRRLTGTAQSYAKAGRTRDAARTYRRAVSMNPFHPDAAKLQLALVDLLDGAGETDQMLTAMDESVDMYGPNSAWARGGIGGEVVQADVNKALRSTVLAHGTTAHQEYNALVAKTHEHPAAQKEHEAKTAAAFRVADRCYTAFTTGFVGDEQYNEIALYHAELHYSAKDYDAAIAKYRAIRDGGSKDAADAGVAIMEALTQMILADVDSGKAKAFDLNVDVTKAPVVKMAEGYPKSVQRYQQEAYVFAERFPKHADASVFVYHAMQFAAAYGHLSDAKKALAVLKKDFPKKRATQLAKKLRARL